ncbi:MAG: aminopeptidase P family protein [Erysipelotrichaceae bacterium]
MNNLTNLQKQISDTQQLIISDPYNINYLINTFQSTGERFYCLLLDNKQKPKLFLNNLFPLELNPNYDIIRFDDTDDIIKLLSLHLNKPNIGVDHQLCSGFLLRLMDNYPAHYFDCSVTINHLRSIKNNEEQQKMIESSKVNDLIMEKVQQYIKIGISELDIYNFIKETQKELGVKPSFDPIVVSGSNCADPHGQATDKLIQQNESIIIDMGVIKDNYCSDMTRTFFINNNLLKEVYDIVKDANNKAEAIIKPGIKFSDIDKTARDYITSKGYGEYFNHRLGHGIGMQVHEPFDVSSSNDLIVEEGMCFSIEPGIYLPNIGGIRIEDLVLVTKDGCKVLNQYPKDQEVM